LGGTQRIEEDDKESTPVSSNTVEFTRFTKLSGGQPYFAANQKGAFAYADS